MFAYGQTGSGKSYSMVGYGKNKGKPCEEEQKMFYFIATKKCFNLSQLCQCSFLLGIVPITCERLFEDIGNKKKEGSKIEYQVSLYGKKQNTQVCLCQYIKGLC